jgi:large subunit ribosomal protein L10
MGRQRLVRELMVENLVKRFSGYSNFVLVDYKGLRSSQSTELRKLLKQEGIWASVCKNSLARISLEKVGLKELSTRLKEMTMVVWGNDPVVILKKLTAFSEKNKVLKIREGYVEGRMMNAREVTALASMPSKQELIGTLVGQLGATTSGFVNVLNQVIVKFVMTLKAIEKK